jgi:hypothetical protein
LDAGLAAARGFTALAFMATALALAATGFNLGFGFGATLSFGAGFAFILLFGRGLGLLALAIEFPSRECLPDVQSTFSNGQQRAAQESLSVSLAQFYSDALRSTRFGHDKR